MILFWYSKCSTCRKAKDFLDKHHCVYDVHDLVSDPLSKTELTDLMDKSGKDVSKFFNTSGIKYRELSLKDKLPHMSRQEKIELLSSDGKLVKRPILLVQDRVLVGFQEKEWSELCENC